MNFTLRKALQKPNPQSPVDASTLFGDQTLSGGANRRRCLTVHCQNASKTVKILDQRLFPLSYFIIGHGGIGIGDSFFILLSRIFLVLGVFCARFPPREASYYRSHLTLCPLS